MRSSSVREIKEMHSTVTDAARKHHVPSLGRSLTILLNELFQDRVYLDQRSFELLVPLAIEKARVQLDPEFQQPSWILSLCEEGLEHMRMISLSPEMMDELRIHEFIEECDRVANARYSNPLMAWSACRARFQVLTTLGFFIHDPCICPIIERLATEDLRRFEGEVSVMNDICPDIPVSLGDMLLDTLQALNLCFALGDSARVKRLRQLIDERASSPSAKIVRLNLLWNDSFAYEDYDSLLRFRSLLSEVKASNSPSNELLEPDFEMRELIAEGILNEEKRFENLARGRLKLLQFEISPEMAVKDHMQYTTFGHVLEAIYCLYKAAASRVSSELASNLHEAMSACEYIRVTEREVSPGYLLYLKTLLLEKMVLGDADGASVVVRKIEKHPFCTKSSEMLASIAERWIEAKGDKVLTVFSGLDYGPYSQSPWIIAGKMAIALDARKAYSEILGSKEPRDPHLVKSGASYWKGRAFELALEICYWNEGYKVRHRLKRGHKEQVDLLCSRTSMGVCEILLVDAKSGNGTYKPKDARDFCVRARELGQMAVDILGLSMDQAFKVRGVIASRGRVTDGAEKELEDGLNAVPYSIISGEQLMKFLADHKVAMPSLAK